MLCEYRGNFQSAKHTWSRAVCGCLLACPESFREKDVCLPQLFGMVWHPQSMVTPQGCHRTRNKVRRGAGIVFLRYIKKKENLVFQSSLIPPCSLAFFFFFSPCRKRVQVSERVSSYENSSVPILDHSTLYCFPWILTKASMQDP